VVRPALLKPIRERRGRRLVEQTLDLEARKLTRDPRRLALRVGEVSWHGGDRLLDLVA